jgi:hypothetical protein
MGIRPITTKRYRVTGARREGGLARSLPGLWPGSMNIPDLRVRSATRADLDAIIGLHIAARNAYYRGFVPGHERAEVAASARWRDGHRRPGSAGVDQLRHTLIIPPT